MADPILAAFGMRPKKRIDTRFKPVKPKAGMFGQGSIKAHRPSLGERIEGGIGSALNWLGVDDRYSRHVAGRAMAPLNDVTPVGGAIGIDDGARTLGNGITRGDLAQGALGAGILGLNILPFAGGAKRRAGNALKGVLADNSGAIRAWHGSPYDFDKFEWSSRTRGTGEGAQSFGDGLYFAESPDVARKYQERLSRGAQGRLYEVDLRPDPSDFLHRDLYLADQSPKVQGAINELPQNAWDWMADEMDAYGMNPIEPGDASYKGHHLIRALERYAGEGGIADSIPFDDPRQHVSEFFRQQGLPGFAFLDGASRKAGSGTNNFVVFDDKLIDIRKKH